VTTLPTIPTTKVLVTLGVDTHSNTHVSVQLWSSSDGALGL
jgi:hypothetical protein